MPGQTSSRVLRYSRQPSLSTINSCEEADFHNSHSSKESPPSPYIGGGSARNSIVSPLTREQQYPDSIAGGFRGHTPFYHIATTTGRPQPLEQVRDRVDHPEVNRSMASGKDNDYKNEKEESYYTIDEPVKAESGYIPRTRWVWMLLELDEIAIWHNALASFCAWIILAAYLIFPATFTSLKSTQTLSQASAGVDKVGYDILMGIDHIGLLAASCILASVGAFGCIFLWIMNRRNYYWLCNKIFMPITLNSLAGLLTTVINVNTAQNKIWSVTAVLNAIISGSVAGVAALVYCVYFFFLLRPIKKEHHRLFPHADFREMSKQQSKSGSMRKWFS